MLIVNIICICLIFFYMEEIYIIINFDLQYKTIHVQAISRSNKTQNTQKQAVLRVYGPNMRFFGKFLFCYCYFKLKSGIANFIIILMEEDLDLILNVYNCIILFINDVFVIYS